MPKFGLEKESLTLIGYGMQILFKINYFLQVRYYRLSFKCLIFFPSFFFGLREFSYLESSLC